MIAAQPVVSHDHGVLSFVLEREIEMQYNYGDDPLVVLYSQILFRNSKSLEEEGIFDGYSWAYNIHKNLSLNDV